MPESIEYHLSGNPFAMVKLFQADGDLFAELFEAILSQLILFL